ncbi:chaperone NapD [Ottowia testudinis]|uniref:Chaperone NapD n=1 Tax=Ottowia testudinis TaxID=2816950 RepID=A0A975H463_9BURK|nr:chaperone NapD [Ottowia testudinis]QTD45991.1 chaperone NapD [Ottowia testudinis]
MSVLGVVVRVHPKHLASVRQRLACTPGLDLGPDPGDGRLIAVIESTADAPAAAIMADIAQWPEVHNLSLVFEQSDPDTAEAPAEFDFRSWRGDVGAFARRQAEPSLSSSPESTGAAHGAGETP